MKYDIAALKRKMLVKYPFFGSVVANVEYRENSNIPTAGTDGKMIYYNPEYLGGLSVEEQTFVFAHEVCHIAFNHILRSEGKDHGVWNIATDAVINQFLKRDGLKMVPGGIDMAEAINYDAEQFYEKLLQEKQQQEQDNSQNQQSSSESSQGDDNQQQSQKQEESSSQNQKVQQQNDANKQQGNSDGENSQEQDKSKQDVGHDTHSMWEQAVRKYKDQKEKSTSTGSLSDKFLENDEEKTEFERKQKEFQDMGEKAAFNKNFEYRKKQLEELKKAISMQAAQAGSSTNRNIITVSNIGTAKPLIDWRYILKEAIKYDVDWSYKNATLENGVVSANLEEQPISETEILLDTSGSIDEILLKDFLRECKNILCHSRVKVGCFDTEFYGFYEIRTEEDIENMEFVGEGGTDFNVAVNAFSRRVENKIIFTDGEAPMPNISLDVIWIVFGGKKINPKGGKVINITPEQLDKLYSCKIQSDIKNKLR